MYVLLKKCVFVYCIIQLIIDFKKSISFLFTPFIAKIETKYKTIETKMRMTTLINPIGLTKTITIEIKMEANILLGMKLYSK